MHMVEIHARVHGGLPAHRVQSFAETSQEVSWAINIDPSLPRHKSAFGGIGPRCGDISYRIKLSSPAEWGARDTVDHAIRNYYRYRDKLSRYVHNVFQACFGWR